MRDSKQKLIYAVFALANLTGKKVYMYEKDYKAFYKASLVKYSDGTESGHYNSDTLVIHDYNEAKKLQALIIDYHPDYGGYRIDFYCGKNGSIDFFFSSLRSNAQILTDKIRFFNNGVLYKKDN